MILHDDIYKSNLYFLLQSKGKQSLSLSNVAGTFHIVIAGLLLAMIFSGLEFLFHFKKKQRKDKKVNTSVDYTEA